jgi:hypothetical protein
VHLSYKDRTVYSPSQCKNAAECHVNALQQIDSQTRLTRNLRMSTEATRIMRARVRPLLVCAMNLHAEEFT